MTETATAAEFAAFFRARLDRLAAVGRTVSFWWRDDDAIEPTAQLDRLIDQAEAADVPLGLAVIPKHAKSSLADRLAASPRVAVLQHGWQHENHEPVGSKAAELGNARPLDSVVGELRRGNARLHELFGARLRPVLVPPWNRISAEVAAARGDAGLVGLSTFNVADGTPHQVNCHLDPIAWKTTRGFIGWPKAGRILGDELGRRLDGSDEPFGLLTHHLVHDEELWQFVETFLAVAASHPAARWPELPEVFALPA